MSRPDPPDPPDPAELTGLARDWFAECARPLPWREASTSPWAILVSEVMLQQTPVSRVIPAWSAWLGRWPTPAACAAAPAGAALRLWGGLGYPRRALRLHAAAVQLVDHYGGEVPESLTDLLALPGVGAYTARAVAGFAFAARHPIVDVNVARVVARSVHGNAEAGVVGARTLAVVDDLLPADPTTAITSCAALMEVGALICTARTPRCSDCPLRAICRWRLAGAPPATVPRRPGPAFDGSDRQARGRLLATLRSTTGSVSARELVTAWPVEEQRTRALAGLVSDGLVSHVRPDAYALIGEAASGEAAPAIG